MRRADRLFNRIASTAAEHVARAWFFSACVLLILLWLPSIFVLRSVDTWQLVINTLTTCITFLLLALLHNTQQRFEESAMAKFDELTQKADVLLLVHWPEEGENP